jgi:hypothetical protein
MFSAMPDVDLQDLSAKSFAAAGGEATRAQERLDQFRRTGRLPD